MASRSFLLLFIFSAAFDAGEAQFELVVGSTGNLYETINNGPFGHPITNRPGQDTPVPLTAIDMSFTIPISGKISAWDIYAVGDEASVTFLVLRPQPLNSTTNFLLTCRDDITGVVSGENHFAIAEGQRCPVEKGDYIGWQGGHVKYDNSGNPGFVLGNQKNCKLPSDGSMLTCPGGWWTPGSQHRIYSIATTVEMPWLSGTMARPDKCIEPSPTVLRCSHIYT